MDNKTQRKLSEALNYHKAGKIKEAEVLYSEILKKIPNDTDILHFCGIALISLGRFDEAVSKLSKASKINPSDAIYCTLGNAYSDKGDIDSAISSYCSAIQLNKANLEAYNNLGMAYTTKNMLNEAVSCYQKAISLDSGNADVYNNLGAAFYKAGNFQESVKCHTKAIELKPDFVNAYFNLGNAYKGSVKTFHTALNENLEKAAACYQKVLEYIPEFVEAYINLGLIAYLRGDEENEINFYNRALELCPNSPELLNNIGVINRDAGRLEESITYFERAIAVNKDYTDAHINLAVTCLALKDFEKGFKHYKHRLNNFEPYKSKIKKIKKPLWTGESLEGKTIYVYHEQGFGDTINFSRYIKLLGSDAAKVLFRPQKELESLFLKNDINAEIIGENISDEALNIDYHTILMNLLEYYKAAPDNIPFNKQYLYAEPEKVQFYKEKYFDNNSFKVGINWQCGNLKQVDKYRSISDIAEFYPFAKLDGVKVYSFQKGLDKNAFENLPDDVEIVDLGNTFNDFSDTAAALENIDLLISVDTAVLHLAGAMGRPAWGLLQFVPDWRWFLKEETTPWYESIRLFRQKQRGNWQPVVTDACSELKSLVCGTIQ